jgi:hypothetical protein
MRSEPFTREYFLGELAQLRQWMGDRTKQYHVYRSKPA